MKKFYDINVAYLDLLSNLKNEGKIKAKRCELPFVTFSLEDMDKNVLFFPFAQRNWPWILRECCDRIFNATNPGISYHFSKNWENRIEENGFYSYHYADRLNSQMQDVLSKKKQSRDKIIQVWKEGDYNLKGRQPCTIIMQPILEYDDKMSLIVYMRNNDSINIFPSDVFIHSTYFKYWCIKNNIEYKNLYWLSAVLYYQKKRDQLKFVDRLLNQWNTNYDSINSTKWDKNIITDLETKEEIEKKIILSNDKEFRKYEAFKCYNSLNTNYVKDWFKIIMLKIFKTDKDKKSFTMIQESDWNTEFKYLKNSIIA